MSALTRLAALEVQARAFRVPLPATAVQLAERIGITLDPWQADVLTSTAKRLSLNVTRQGGKSTVAAILAVYQALTEPGALVLLLSPTLRQSSELFKKCLAVYRDADRPVPPEAETQLTLMLTNGSRLVSLPGKEQSIRGFSGVRLLVIDEAARVPDELYFSTRPMLAVSAGRIVTMSTPFGRRGWWATAWHSAEPWERTLVTARECPRITPDFLAEEERVMGEWWFRQEYFGEFLDSQTAAFRSEDVERAFSSEVDAWSL